MHMKESQLILMLSKKAIVSPKFTFEQDQEDAKETINNLTISDVNLETKYSSYTEVAQLALSSLDSEINK